MQNTPSKHKMKISKEIIKIKNSDLTSSSTYNVPRLYERVSLSFIKEEFTVNFGEFTSNSVILPIFYSS